MAKLAQQRSPASAALLFLLLVDEIEGLAFLAVGVLMKRPDLFLDSQSVVFPTICLVAAAVAVARNWRRRQEIRIASVEPVALSVLAERIGGGLAAPGRVAEALLTPAQPTFRVHVSSGPMGQTIPLRMSEPVSASTAAESEYRRSIAALRSRHTALTN